MRTGFRPHSGLPLLLVLFDDDNMDVSEIEVDGRDGQPVMPKDFLHRCQGEVLLKGQGREGVPEGISTLLIIRR